MAGLTYDHGAGALRRLPLKGLGGFALAPGDSPRIAAFVAESKGSPGFVGVWDTAALGSSRDPAPLARRSFFRVRTHGCTPRLQACAWAKTS